MLRKVKFARRESIFYWAACISRVKHKHALGPGGPSLGLKMLHLCYKICVITDMFSALINPPPGFLVRNTFKKAFLILCNFSSYMLVPV